MSDNKNSFLYTKFLQVYTLVSTTSMYLFNTLTNNTYYHFVKNKFVALQNSFFTSNNTTQHVDEGVHVDSDNLFFNVSNVIRHTNDKPLQIDTDVKLDNE